MQKFYKGRTNNHLTWKMVDATDFATPESALSAATKIKIYGKLRSGTGTNFVSSGTGSLTNDITHVGASALGIYTIALVKADLSDASAAWYDQYIISLSATGAAYQMLVVDGGIDDSNLSAIVSDLTSALLVTQSMASDAASAATQANSRVLLNQSRISDVYSMLSDLLSDFQSRVPKAVATNSQLSDLHSDLRSYVVGLSATVSGIYSALSDVQSDFQSRVPKRVATDSQLSDLASDLKSAIAGITATVGASDISDIASAVWANTIGARVDSRVLLNLSYLSDIRSHVSDLQSDFQSRVPKRVATDSQLSDLHSDLKSHMAVSSGVQSDIYSLLSDFQSDFGSRVPKRVATDSQLSDVHSDLKSAIGAITVSISASDVSDIASAVVAGLPVASQISDIYSLLSDFHSDFQSRVPKRVATDSQLSDLHSDLKSHLAVSSGVQSDIYSLLSDVQSDFQSRVPKRVATDSQLSDVQSDLRSLVGTRAIPGDAMALTSSERDAVANALLDLANAVETGVTTRGALRLTLAALAGKLSGAATTTVTIRNAVADSKDRITATVDSNGNRTAVSTDLT